MKKNTEIYLWVEPLVQNHERNVNEDIIYFKCTVEGRHSLDDLDRLIDVRIMDRIMDAADIQSNWNYKVVSARYTEKEPGIEIVESEDDLIMADLIEEEMITKPEKEISKLVLSKTPITLTKENVEVMDAGMIEVSLPALAWKEKINFPKIWETLEKDFIGKIKEGDTVTLSDDNGNVIFEITGGSFLNIAHGDMLIYDPKKKSKNPSLFNKGQGLKGGLYVRNDGSLDIGDFKRTFMLTIYTNNLLKASLKLNKSLEEVAQLKLTTKK